MIVEYHRPDNMKDALDLLVRSEVTTFPLGGGTILNQPSAKPFAVVDLQDLNLNKIEEKGKKLEVGSTVTLQQFLEIPEIFQPLQKAIYHEASYNLRQVATVAGTLVAADGRSPFATSMFALGAELTIHPNEETIEYGSFLPLRTDRRMGYLITKITIPNNVQFAYEYVARSPADLPIVCVAVVQWPSGRTRVALGGFGNAPLLAMDGPEPTGAEAAARDAYHEANDAWASAEYRRDVAATLVKRCLP